MLLEICGGRRKGAAGGAAATLSAGRAIINSAELSRDAALWCRVGGRGCEGDVNAARVFFFSRCGGEGQVSQIMLDFPGRIWAK